MILPAITTIISSAVSAGVDQLLGDLKVAASANQARFSTLESMITVANRQQLAAIKEVKELIKAEMAQERKRGDNAINRLTYLAMQNSLRPTAPSTPKKSGQPWGADLFEELPDNHADGYRMAELELEEVYEEQQPGQVEELED